MAVLEIQQFNNKSSVLDDQKNDQQDAGTENIAIGTDVKDPSLVQITSQPDESFSDSINSIVTALGKADKTIKVAIDKPAFQPKGPGQGKVVEFVQSTFAASRVTPEFKQKIKEDFLKFESIFSREPIPGAWDWTVGWTTEDADHEAIQGEKTRSFVVIRSWDSMAVFQAAMGSEAFKEAIPILSAWQAPYKMVSTLESDVKM